ncbi:MAG: hypothetical protein CMM44_04495 [Rhodospirillaceae bacterium]|nr:hypothetical protein [Rhodospirillaceae bacterium]|tara:strand:+ start:2931 stop:3329 length:399 start_codon:yes stop_codon:yes gene_type:complete
MTEYNKLQVIKSEVVSATHRCSVLENTSSLFIKSRLVNISAGYVNFTIFTRNSNKKSIIQILPDQTTMRCELIVEKHIFDNLLHSLQRSRSIKIIIETHLDTELVISDKGDLIIEHDITAQVRNCKFIQNFI